eukprot:1186460-Prorocentrum_minimum.AAC.2
MDNARNLLAGTMDKFTKREWLHDKLYLRECMHPLTASGRFDTAVFETKAGKNMFYVISGIVTRRVVQTTFTGIPVGRIYYRINALQHCVEDSGSASCVAFN